MDAGNINLLDFINSGKRTFCIPVYQRNYDWKKLQCVKLFEDIISVAKDENKCSHFLGTMVYVEGNKTPSFREFIVIDGQQRLTSVMLLLKTISDVTEDISLKQEIEECYLVNKFAPENMRMKLKPMKSDCLNYEKLINNKIEEMEESQLIVNYTLFKDLVEDSALSPFEIFQGIQKLEIVYIELDKENENAQVIFESLNSTGLDLAQADLIRNYLLMGQNYSVQEYLYSNYWLKIEKLLPDALISDYIRDYLTLKTANIPNKDKVYEEFKKYYSSILNYDIEGFLEELKTFAEYYSMFKYCNSIYPNLNTRLSNLQKLKSTVVYPFLLNAFEDCFLYRKIDIYHLCNTIDIIISYVLRRLLCDIPTNALNKVFASMTNDILKYRDISYEDRVAKFLFERKGRAIFPSDEMVKERLRAKDCYSFPHIKFILCEIERNMSKEVVHTSNLSVEHIMPQTLSTKWKVDLGKNSLDIHEKNLNKIGNLTLTGYNAELSNKSFVEKLSFYKNSNLKITRDVLTYSEWGENEIFLRGEILSNQIIQIWSRPNIVTDNMQTSQEEATFDIFDDTDVTGTLPKELIIFDEIFNIRTWKEFLICICKQMYEYDSQIFSSLTKHTDFEGNNRRIISSDEIDMRKPYQISENVFVETNLSANDILNYSKLIIDKFEDMSSVISFTIKQKTGETITKTNSDKYISNFSQECADVISEKLKKIFKKKNRSTYISDDGKIGIVISISKIYKQGNREKYWFGFRNSYKEYIKNCDRKYIAFGCNNEDTILLMPLEIMENEKQHLNVSFDSEGNISHWHIVFFKDDNDNITWLYSLPEVKEININNFLL